MKGFFGETTYTAKEETAFDKSKLETQVKALNCAQKENQVAPENAYVSFNNSEFTIVPETEGTELKVKEAYQMISEAISSDDAEVDLGSNPDAYVTADVTSDSADLQATVDAYNNFAKASITYTFGDETVTLDGNTIKDWLQFDEKGQLIQDDASFKQHIVDYVAQLAASHDTVGTERQFQTTSGRTVSVYGSAYGWKIDQDAEVAQLTQEIQSGTQTTREPVYSMTANSHGKNDYGDSYVEINLTAQHMFLYKDGKLVIDSDFVSGNVSKNNATPTGAYGVTYTEKNATLRGENYETPVTYWMPFAGNVGMHDAYWRSKFGGSIYKYAGSHGCINLPPEVAKVVFENVKKNYPVLVYELPGTESTDATDKEEAKKVVKLIDALGTITKDSKEAVQKARNAYDKLTANDKVYVTNYDKLKKAEEKLQKLQKNSKQRRSMVCSCRIVISVPSSNVPVWQKT